MEWVGSPAQSQMNLFLEYPFPRKSVVMSLKKKTWQKQSPGIWLLLIGQSDSPLFVFFLRKVYEKISIKSKVNTP